MTPTERVTRCGGARHSRSRAVRAWTPRPALRPAREISLQRERQGAAERLRTASRERGPDLSSAGMVEASAAVEREGERAPMSTQPRPKRIRSNVDACTRPHGTVAARRSAAPCFRRQKAGSWSANSGAGRRRMEFAMPPRDSGGGSRVANSDTVMKDADSRFALVAEILRSGGKASGVKMFQHHELQRVGRRHPLRPPLRSPPPLSRSRNGVVPSRALAGEDKITPMIGPSSPTSTSST